MASIQEIQQILQNFVLDRPSLQKNNNPEKIIQLLQNELVEVSQSLTDTENLVGEISDLIIFSLTLANLYGFDMGEEILTKISYNHARFPAIDFNNNYDEAIAKGKSREVWVKPMFKP